MKCTLQYDAGEWLCLCDELFSLLENELTPVPEIVQAIEEFRRRYYPDEPIDVLDYPWVRHKDTETADLRGDVVKYELTWHWRLLLPCLRDFEAASKSDDSIVLCVSQIRQWQLVSCFRMKWPIVAEKDLPARLRADRKELLRPPVFGKSHRITRWEVYASFYETGIKEQIKRAVEQAKEDPFRLAHILGRYDAYFKVESVKPEAGRYVMETKHVIDLDPEQAPAELNGEQTDDVCRPYGLACLPLFADGFRPKRFVAGAIKQCLVGSAKKQSSKEEKQKPKELLFSSDNYCRAFEQVSDVLNDHSAGKILIIAPPGSGKEDLSEIFHVCRRQNGQLVRTILAGLDEKAAAFQLFNLSLKDIDRRLKHNKNTLEPVCPFPCCLEDGAVFKALEGTLVIDELDKAEGKVRSMLLRFLESDEITVAGTSVVLKIPASMRPLYVFAGSKTRKEFLQLEPIDFWSRITHIVEMQHPLELGEAADRLRTAQDYLRLFWFKEVKSFFEGEELLKPSGDLFEPLRTRFSDWWKFFCSRDLGEFVTREVSDTLCAPGQPVPSIRTLRGTVSRCFNSLFHALLYHKRNGAPLEIWAEKLASSTIRKEPIERLRELMSMLHARTARTDFTLEDEGAIAEIRALIRASANIQV